MSSRTQFGCCKIPLHYIIKYNNWTWSDYPILPIHVNITVYKICWLDLGIFNVHVLGSNIFTEIYTCTLNYPFHTIVKTNKINIPKIHPNYSTRHAWQNDTPFNYPCLNTDKSFRKEMKSLSSIYLNINLLWIICPVNNSHDSLHFLSKSNPGEKKGLLTSATFQVILHAFQFICCDLQMIYDQSFCYNQLSTG
jgi:hypothetical protein